MQDDSFTTLVNRLQSCQGVVGIMGLGYVGLPLAATFAEGGFTVIGFDIAAHKIDELRMGHSYIRHVPAERLRQIVRSEPFRRGDPPVSIPAQTTTCWPNAMASSSACRLRSRSIASPTCPTSPGPGPCDYGQEHAPDEDLRSGGRCGALPTHQSQRACPAAALRAKGGRQPPRAVPGARWDGKNGPAGRPGSIFALAKNALFARTRTFP